MAASLYPQRVLDHQRHPRHRGALGRCTHAADGANPLCGDRLRIELCVEHGRIVAFGHVGEACAVAIAAASMLGDLVTGADAAAVDALYARFAAFIAGDGDADGLGELAALEPLRRHPLRRKCALLAWAALRAALAGEVCATTEKETRMGDRNEGGYTFRAARTDDVAAIVALVQSAYRGDASRVGWTTEAELLDGQRTDPAGVAAIIEAPDSLVLLAERGGELVACAHVEKQDDAGYFGMFSVRPTLQGSGVGRVVLAEAERIARERWQCREMQMTVISVRDELIAWYERRGYHRTGVYTPFPYGDERFGIPRRDDLRFELLSKTL